MNYETPLHKYVCGIFIRNEAPYSYYFIRTGGKDYIDRVGVKGLINGESFVCIERIKRFTETKDLNDIGGGPAMKNEFSEFQKEYIKACCISRNHKEVKELVNNE